MIISKEVIFKGSTGRLEGKYYQSSEKGAPIALVMHPHPLFGGTMNNKVIHSIAAGFLKHNFSVLRFNFRGVGKSSGVFDHGIGELLDASTALDWLQSINPEARGCWVSGFSFGGWIALQLLMRRPEIFGFVVVSPPVNTYPFDFLSPCPIRGLVLHGGKDSTVAESEVYKLYEKLDKQRHSDVEYIMIDNACHAFKDHLSEVSNAIVAHLESRINKGSVYVKAKKDRRRKSVLQE